MDCEKFDRVVLDLLYEELDELTSAAAKRHMEHCARCRSIGSGLRATREVGVLPMLEPPEGLAGRILDAERKVRARLPLGQRIGRAISVAADYAMRPQLAMAAVLLLMIGASLVFLRVEPGQRDNVHVTERGVPEAEGETVAIVPLPEKRPASESAEDLAAAPEPLAAAARRERGKAESESAPAAPGAPAAVASAAPVTGAAGDPTAADAGAGDSDYEQAMSAFTAGRYAEAQRGFDAVAAKQGTNAPSAALFAARANRADIGCEEAAERFERVNTLYKGTNIGHEAAWQAADCYRSLGKANDARKHYQHLLEVAAYRDRAQQALAALDQEMVASRADEKSRAAAKAKASKPAATATAPAKKAAPAEQPKAGENSAF